MLRHLYKKYCFHFNYENLIKLVSGGIFCMLIQCKNKCSLSGLPTTRSEQSNDSITQTPAVFQTTAVQNQPAATPADPQIQFTTFILVEALVESPWVNIRISKEFSQFIAFCIIMEHSKTNITEETGVLWSKAVLIGHPPGCIHFAHKAFPGPQPMLLD